MDTPAGKDRRVKREIANSNERRRMQSINAGFQKLKRLLPVHDGEKISKANILQNAADYVQRLHEHIHEQNDLFRTVLLDIKNGRKDIDAALESFELEFPTVTPLTNVSLTATINNCSESSNINNKNNNSNSSTSVSIVPDNIAAIQNGVTIKSETIAATQSCVPIPDNIAATQAGSVTIPNDIAATQNNNGKPNCNDINAGDKIIAPKNGLSATGVAKAAIALPLEVPYTSETIIRLQQNLHTDGAPKGQNLDTICKAIMEIEGDRVFKARSRVASRELEL